MQQSIRLSLACVFATAVVCAFGGACEKPIHEAKATKSGSQSTAVSVAPATQPADGATPAAAVIPASRKSATTSQPAMSLLTIDGLGAEFPPTKLLMHERGADGKIAAELFSDLPKSALRKYDGNELYLEMKLDDVPGSKPQTSDAATVPWHFKSTQSGRVDSPNGIFLHGQSTHLQPSDVWVKFDRDGDRLVAQIIGQFRAYQSNTPDALAPEVGVSGALPVEIAKQR